MKMGVGIFWGLILIVVGVSIIFKVVFDINILRVVIAVIFILIGIKILIGKPGFHFDPKDNEVIFGEKAYTAFPAESTEFNNIFGKSVYDYRQSDFSLERTIQLEYNAIFGASVILLPANIPVEIKGESVFGSVKMPNGNQVSFGDIGYKSSPDTIHVHMVKIKAAAVFGNIEIK